MTVAGTTQFEILQSHLNIYNKILKKNIWLQKGYTIKLVLKNIKMI